MFISLSRSGKFSDIIFFKQSFFFFLSASSETPIICIVISFMVFHMLRRLSSSLFILFFPSWSSDWIMSSLSSSLLILSSIWLSLLLKLSMQFFSVQLLCSSAPEFLFGSFVWFMSLCWTSNFFQVLFPDLG